MVGYPIGQSIHLQKTPIFQEITVSAPIRVSNQTQAAHLQIIHARAPHADQLSPDHY